MRSLFIRVALVGVIVFGITSGSSFATARALAVAVKTDAQGNVARWDPCSTIQWKLATEYTNTFFVKTLNRAINQLNSATGLHFQYGGVASREEARNAPNNTLVISVAQQMAGPMVAGTTHLDFVDGVNNSLVINGATVAISSRVTKGHLRTLLLPVMLHELGHVVGLAHVDDPRNIMYPRAIRTIQYSPSEIADFAPFGSGAGCHPVLDSANL